MHLSGAHGPKLCAREFPNALLNVYVRKKAEKTAHIGRTVRKIVCPKMELCVPGSECAVNFEHCFMYG